MFHLESSLAFFPDAATIRPSGLWTLRSLGEIHVDCLSTQTSRLRAERQKGKGPIYEVLSSHSSNQSGMDLFLTKGCTGISLDAHN